MTSQLSPAGATRNGYSELRLPDSGGRILAEFTLPIRTVNALNVREHWRKRAHRAKDERMASSLLTPRNISLPCTVTLTRVAPRSMDGDGLQASFKNLRDGVADRLNVNDNDPRVEWHYTQEKAKTYGVRIRIEAGT